MLNVTNAPSPSLRLVCLTRYGARCAAFRIPPPVRHTIPCPFSHSFSLNTLRLGMYIWVNRHARWRACRLLTAVYWHAVCLDGRAAPPTTPPLRHDGSGLNRRYCATRLDSIIFLAVTHSSPRLRNAYWVTYCLLPITLLSADTYLPCLTCSVCLPISPMTPFSLRRYALVILPLFCYLRTL